MKTKALLAALALTLAPSIAAAQCNYLDKTAQTTTCAPGMVWDATSATCVATTG